MGMILLKSFLLAVLAGLAMMLILDRKAVLALFKGCKKRRCVVATEQPFPRKIIVEYENTEPGCPTFEFKALNERGEEVEGTFKAPDASRAVTNLRLNRLFPTAIKEVEKTSSNPE